MSRSSQSDPQQVARAAGLRYVTDETPGISRRRCGRGFAYYSPAGKLIRDEPTLTRIRALAIPPAYRDVWICPDPGGHLQATGRDDAGRKQYRYHPDWNDRASRLKYGNLVEFARCLPGLRRRIRRDLSGSELTRRTVVATVVRLLDETLIRVGNDSYAHQNGSFGLTTLRDRHVKLSGPTLRFQFNGKSGQEHDIELKNGRLARLVKRCQDVPGQRLFQYVDERGNREAIQSQDVNEYLREVTCTEVTAKHFRTWGGTVLAAMELARQGDVEGKSRRKKAIVAAVKGVAAQLGNRPATCRKYYIHPAVLEAFEEGTLPELMGDCTPAEGVQRRVPAAGLSPEERAVLKLLERDQRKTRTAPAREPTSDSRKRSRSGTKRGEPLRPVL
jgi:DNA topoisomerase-1